MTIARIIFVLLAAAVAGCTHTPPHPERFSFAVMGDTPYNDHEERLFLQMLDDLNAAPLKFVVHVGDFKAGGNAPCTDALFEKRRAQFARLKHPVVFLPGDNDWVDCRRETNGAMNPLERLAALRKVFFEGVPLDQALAPVTAEECSRLADPLQACAASYPEIRSWSLPGAAFIALNLQGSNDNAGFDPQSDAEAKLRSETNLQRLEQLFGRARLAEAKAVVVIAHANPLVESKTGAYDALVKALSTGAEKLAKPVLFIHGDTHQFRIDRPFKSARGETLGNLTRLESFGSPVVGWVRVDVDQNDPAVFRVEIGQTY